MSSTQNDSTDQKSRSLVKWIWNNRYRGQLFGAFAFLSAGIGTGLAFFVTWIVPNTDIPPYSYIVHATGIIVQGFFFLAFILFFMGFFLVSDSMANTIAGLFRLFTTPKK
jgi:hypothetical protein